MSYPNPDNYPEIDADKFNPIGDRVLVKWDEKTTTVLNGKLLTPQTTRKQHYTGTVIAVSRYSNPQIRIGNRILFEQFSGFEKFYDPKYGRLALVDRSSEGACLAIIPKRANIGEGEADFDYDKD